MSITKRFLDWVEEKYNALDFEHDSYAKCSRVAIGTGLVEGLIDGFVFVGATSFIWGVIQTIGKICIYFVSKKN